MAARQLAVVTGASSGIGLELARVFADEGYDLLVVADDPQIFHAAGTLLHAGVRVEPLQADLRVPEAAERVRAVIQAGGRVPSAVALNAGIGRAGRFIDGDIDDDLAVIDVNVRSTVHLAKLLLPDMAARRAGRVLITSSLVAMIPGSFQAMYNASKSFLQSFAAGLHDELRDSGVSVTALMPGATDTDFFRRNRMTDTVLGRFPGKDDPAKTARQGFDAMMRGDQSVVASSCFSTATALLLGVLPDAAKAVGNRIIATPFGQR